MTRDQHIRRIREQRRDDDNTRAWDRRRYVRKAKHRSRQYQEA
jgi:hypothetical protein